MRNRKPFDPAILNDWKGQMDRTIPTPLYYQLKLIIKQYIDEGKFKSGNPVPTEEELSAALDISRPTIRQCMQELVNENYLIREKGKGTFVAQPRIELNYIARHESFHEIISNHGYTPRTRVLTFEEISPVEEINKMLQIGPEERLYFLRRLCMADEKPMLYCESYLQASRFPGLLKQDFSQKRLYATLNELYHTHVNMLRREISATNAGQADAGMLGIAKGKAIFIVCNLASDEQNKPVEYSISHYRTETIKFTNYMKC